MRLEQVFIDLLNNAARYGRRGGQVRVRAWRDGRQVMAAIRDEGIGVPPDKLLVTFQHSRSCIAASMVCRQASASGSRWCATCCSAGEGQGSEFVVRLPAGAGGG